MDDGGEAFRVTASRKGPKGFTEVQTPSRFLIVIGMWAI